MAAQGEGLPISQQFVVLEKILPELRVASGDAEHANRLKAAWHSLPPLAQLPIALAATSLLLLWPIAACLYLNVYGRAKYTVFQYVPLEQTDDWIELTRWLIVLEVAAAGWIIAYYTSILAPQCMAYLAKRNRQTFSSTLVAVIEMVSMIWRYLCYNVFSTLVWLVALKVMPYPAELLLGEKVNAAYYWTHLPWQFYIERVLLIVCLSSFFLTAEKAVLHAITKEFNQSLHRDRIQRCLYSLWVIDVLRKAGSVFGYTHISRHAGNFERLWKLKACPYKSSDLMSIFILEHFVKLGKKSGERKQTMAKRIFRFLASPERGSHLLAGDILPFFTKGEVDKVFSALDVGAAGNVSEAEFVKAVDGIYQERADLIKVLVTNSDVVSRLDQLMLVSVGILVFFIVFPIVGFSPSEALIPLGVSLTPTIVACTLIFGESIKSIFAAIVFLFVTHPYDVGDRVYMDQGSYFVREIGLLSTTFERWDGFIVYIPNSVLATKAICNVRRTGSQSQRIELTVPASVSNSTLAELDRRITTFAQGESRDFATVRASSVEIRELNQRVLVVTLRHRFNFQDGYERVMRNNKFMQFLAETANELGIEYYSTVVSCVCIGGAAMSGSTFSLPVVTKVHPPFRCHRQANWTPRLCLAVLLTATNVTCTAVSVLLISQSNYRWGIILQLGILVGAVSQSAISSSVRRAARWECPQQVAWAAEACLAATQGRLSPLLTFGTMSLAIELLLPSDALADWDEFPWTFALSHAIFIVAIYSAMSLAGEVLVQAAQYQYDNDKRREHSRQLLADLASIAIFQRHAGDGDTAEEGSGLKAWGREISNWARPKWNFVARERLSEITAWATGVDAEALSLRIWTFYREMTLQDPATDWSDFASYLLTAAGSSEPAPGGLASAKDAIAACPDLQAALEQAIKRAQCSHKETTEQERLFDQLRFCLSVTWAILVVVVVLPQFGFSPNAWLLPLGVSVTPTVIALTVTFGQNVSALITALIWTFYIHPFDVGDEVRINKVPFGVNRIGLTHCVLLSSTGMQVYYPNSLLLDANIVNSSRAANLTHHIEAALPRLESDAASRLAQVLVERIARAVPQAKASASLIDVGENGGCRLCVLTEQENNITSAEATECRQLVFRILLTTLQEDLSIGSISGSVLPVSILNAPSGTRIS